MIALLQSNHWTPPAREAARILLDAGLKSIVVLLLTGLALACMKHRSAAARHLVCFLAMASLLLLPALSATLPGWRVLPNWMAVRAENPPMAVQPVENFSPNEPKTATAPDSTPLATALRVSPQPAPLSQVPKLPLQQLAASIPPAPEPAPVNWWRAGLLAWLSGVVLALVPALLGMASLLYLEYSSQRETGPAWLDLLGQLLTRLGCQRRVVLLKATQRRMPMTWGVLRPKVLLPEESREWPPERRRVVLLHELAHAHRFDYLTHLITRLVCALYWFNPLVWLAARRMIAEREHACDDIVLRHGAEPADYAEQVLEISAGLSPGWLAGFGGIAMARPSNLESRLRAILDTNRQRTAPARLAVLLTLAAALLVVVPVAILRAAPSSAPPAQPALRAQIPKQPEAILSDLRKIMPEDWTCQLVRKPGAVGLGTLPSVDPLFCIEFTNPEELSSEIYPLDKPPPPPTLRLYFLPADGPEKEQFEEKSKLRPWLYLAFAETPNYLVVISPTKISVDQDGGPYLIRCIAPLGRALTNYFGKPTDGRTETQLGLVGHGAGELTTESGFAGQVVDDQTGKPIKKFRLEFDPKSSHLNDGPLIFLSAPGNFFAGRFAIEGGHLSSFLSFGEMKWENPPLWPAGQRVTGQVKADGYLAAPLTPDPVVWPVKLTNLMIRLKRVSASAQPAPTAPARASSNPQSAVPNPQSIPALDPVPAPAVENPPGLTVEIRCTNIVFKQGDEIPIEFIIHNHSTQNCQFCESDWGPTGRNEDFKLYATGPSGDAIPDPQQNRKPESGDSLTNGFVPISVLHPGETYSNKIVLLNRWALITQPGSYQVAATFGRVSEPGRFAKSDPIRVTILPRTKEELHAYINALTNQIEMLLSRHPGAQGGPSSSLLVEPLLKLIFTGSPEATSTLLHAVQEDSQVDYDAVFWGEEGLLYYIPHTGEIRHTILDAAGQHPLNWNWSYLLQRYDIKADEIKRSVQSDGGFPPNAGTAGGIPSGISLKIRCTNDVLKVGDEIPIEITISNHGPRDYQFVMPFPFPVSYGEVEMVARTAVGKVVAAPPRQNRAVQYARQSLRLAPGQSFSTVIPLNLWALIKEPGSYQIVGTCIVSNIATASSIYAGPLMDEKRGLATSEPVSITVLPRTKQEMDDYIKGLTNQVNLWEQTQADDSALDVLVKKLMYTCSPNAVPTLLRLMAERGSRSGDWVWWRTDALTCFIPHSEEVRTAIADAVGKEPPDGNLRRLLQMYDSAVKADERVQPEQNTAPGPAGTTGGENAVAATNQIADGGFLPKAATSDWGDPVNGMRTRLVAETNEFRAGEPIKLRLEVENVGAQTRTFQRPAVPYNDSLIVLNADGKAVPCIAMPVQVAVPGINLPSGQTRQFDSLDLTEDYYLRRPGHYTVQLPAERFLLRGLDPNMVGLPLSGKLAFTVVADPAALWETDPDGRLLLLAQVRAWPGRRLRERVRPGSNREEVFGGGLKLEYNPTGKAGDSSTICLWQTEQPAAERDTPPGDATPPSEYMGQAGPSHLYLSVDPKVLKTWPTAKEDILRTLRNEAGSEPRADAPEQPPNQPEGGKHPKQSATTNGIHYAAGFTPEKTEFAPGEPIYLYFDFTNVGSRKILMAVSSYQLSLGGPYRIRAFDSHGESIPDPGGASIVRSELVGVTDIEPGHVYVDTLYLPTFAPFEKPGEYTVIATRDISICDEDFQATNMNTTTILGPDEPRSDVHYVIDNFFTLHNAHFSTTVITNQFKVTAHDAPRAGASAQPASFVPDPAHTNPSSFAKPTEDRQSGWGDPSNGISVRLTAAGPVWDFQQQGFFKFSVRNQGQALAAVWRSQAEGELEMDGVWYQWSQPVDAKTSVLRPGGQFDDLPITIGGGEWRKDDSFLSAGVGKHTIRFAITAKPDDGGVSIRVVSNPVEVEFRWPPNATGLPDTFIPGDLPIIAHIEGRVVDDETGAVVTNFTPQMGVVNPAKPDEITWSLNLSGRMLGNEGRFRLEGRKPGQTWRILADGYLPQMVLEHPLTGTLETSSLVVRLKRGGELRGVVANAAGQPVPDAKVVIHRAEGSSAYDVFPEMRGVGDTATTTDASGYFTLRGADFATAQQVVITSADGEQVQSALQPAAGQEMKITLLPPAALIIRYNIPGDAPLARVTLWLRSADPQASGSSGMGFSVERTITNGGQILLTNLTPGTYEFNRAQILPASAGGGGTFYERRTIILDSGGTQQLNLVRTNGWRVRGQITGLDHANIKRATLAVRSALVGGQPGSLMDNLLPCYDALAYPENFGVDGKFQTALLEPGEYNFVVEVDEPEVYPTEVINGVMTTVIRSGWPLPALVGTAKVTVAADVAPAPVKIDLHPSAHPAK